jgi:hypothetical protein
LKDAQSAGPGGGTRQACARWRRGAVRPRCPPVQKERAVDALAITIALSPGRHLIRFDRIEAELTRTADRQALLRNRRFGAGLRSARRLLGVLHDGKPGLLSLDVFDTLLLRDGSSELRRFGEIGARMAAASGQ